MLKLKLSEEERIKRFTKKGVLIDAFYCFNVSYDAKSYSEKLLRGMDFFKSYREGFEFEAPLERSGFSREEDSQYVGNHYYEQGKKDRKIVFA